MKHTTHHHTLSHTHHCSEVWYRFIQNGIKFNLNSVYL
uniref:Uncharacterized protein n=1 Tax=Anguilla anguilla TaxID=7936 RepID=A0A0E9P909_ANGAN